MLGSSVDCWQATPKLDPPNSLPGTTTGVQLESSFSFTDNHAEAELVVPLHMVQLCRQHKVDADIDPLLQICCDLERLTQPLSVTIFDISMHARWDCCIQR